MSPPRMDVVANFTSGHIERCQERTNPLVCFCFLFPHLDNFVILRVPPPISLDQHSGRALQLGTDELEKALPHCFHLVVENDFHI